MVEMLNSGFGQLFCQASVGKPAHFDMVIQRIPRIRIEEVIIDCNTIV
jgi:hypothetical protein